jgi:hypothetical protein
MNLENDVKVNPLLGRLRIPGETYRLPSHGVFYDRGELDGSVKNGELEVHPMTATDEIILSTPDKLLSGKAIAEIFANCIPQIKRPLDMLAKDVDFLLVCLRMVSFGRYMEVTYQHNCENAKGNNYNVDLQQMIQSTTVVDPTKIEDDYVTVLPNGQKVTLNPLTYGNIIELYQTVALTKADNITQQEAEILVINTLASVIRRVDEIEDKEFIKQWVGKLPLGWKRLLEKSAQSIGQWGVDFTSHQTCKDCNSEMEVPVSANPVSFFT